MTEPVSTQAFQPDFSRRLSIATLKTYSFLLPFIGGLAASRVGIIAASYGSYTQTDEGIFTDGSMLITLALLAFVWILLVVGKIKLKRAQVNRLIHVSVALESSMLIILAGMEFLNIQSSFLRLMLCAATTLVGSLAIFYWLRRVRGSHTVLAAAITFASLFISEIAIYACALMPSLFSYITGALLVLVQYPCIKSSRKKSKHLVASSSTKSQDYFGFAQSLISNKQFLAVTAIGIGLLSLVIGLLRGYPSGEPIVFKSETRVAYLLLTLFLSLTIVLLVIRGRKQVMTIGIWIIMQTLAGLALFLYVAFPHSLDIGAVFTTTLNAMMVGFTWYVIIAFMSYGWRDPYYYAIACWLVWLGSRAIARIVLFEFYPLNSNDMLIEIFISSVLLISTQTVFVQFISIIRHENKTNQERKTLHQNTLYKIMGLDGNESFADMRQASMQHNAEEMGKQFLLSERETEVLALYALGFTQKRVAENLYISQGTAHAHIKRIYAKTGLHSRQELLDYMTHYTT